MSINIRNAVSFDCPRTFLKGTNEYIAGTLLNSPIVKNLVEAGRKQRLSADRHRRRRESGRVPRPARRLAHINSLS